MANEVPGIHIVALHSLRCRLATGRLQAETLTERGYQKLTGSVRGVGNRWRRVIYINTPIQPVIFTEFFECL